VLGYICWNRGVEVLGASRAGPFMYLMPVYTPLLGWMFLDERMQAFHLIGVGLIFGGILLTRLGARPGT
jgi:drug/metabolite transporter (DMT)-like permease